MSRSDDAPVMSDDETVKLLEALGRGQAGFTIEEGERVYRWAHETRIAAALLELLLTDQANIRFREDGEMLFSKVEPS